MSWSLKFTNYRVTIEPDTRWTFMGVTSKDERDKLACDKIVEAVKRHVDDVAHVRVDRDALRVCSFCGYEAQPDEWNEGGASIPCCDEAVAEYELGRAEEALTS